MWTLPIRPIPVAAMFLISTGAALAQCELTQAGIAGQKPELTGGWPYAMATFDAGYGAELFVGGDFEQAGNVAANGVARFDGRFWRGADDGLPAVPSRIITALGVHNGELYMGGQASFGGSQPSAFLARWNGASWTILETEFAPAFSSIAALVSFNGSLYVGGYFTGVNGAAAGGLAFWDGAAVQPLDTLFQTNGSIGWVNTATTHDGELVIGGLFSRVDDAPASNVASWDGVHWRGLDAGLSRDIYSLTRWRGELAVSGAFVMPGEPSTASGIAVWNGTTWRGLAPPTMAGTWPKKCVAFEDDLYFFALFQNHAGVVRYDGSAWSDVGGGINERVNTTCVLNDRLVIGGRITRAGNVLTNDLALWDGAAWSSPFFGSRRLSLGSQSVKTAGDRIIFESFLPGFPSYGSIHSWVPGAGWSQLGPLSEDGFIPHTGYFQGGVYKGDRLVDESGTRQWTLMHWNGTDWHEVLRIPTSSSFTLLPAETTLYLHSGELVGGWDGSAFTPLPGVTWTQLSADIVWNEQPAFSGLCRVGSATPAEQVVTRVNGGWLALGGAFAPGAPSSLAVWNGDLYAAGNIATVNGTPINRVVRWNGTAWESLPPLENVGYLHVFEGRLFATDTQHAFEFLGSDWIPAPGLEGTMGYTIGDLNGHEVIVTNDIFVPGGAVSLIGRFRGGDVNLDGIVDLQDLATLLGSFGYTEGLTRTDGDLNGDYAVGMADLALLLSAMGESCE